LIAERVPGLRQYSQYALIILLLVLIYVFWNFLQTQVVMPFILNVGLLTAWLFGIA